MPIGKDIEQRGHITGFREEISRAAESSRDEFFRWFDAAGTIEESFIRGQWDFSLHVARRIAPLLSKPEQKTVLEIGYGGGRILAAAARAFGKAVGVDIHNFHAFAQEALNDRGVKNIELLGTDGTTLPVGDGSVDVVYSFIVLQHVEKIAIWNAYVRETARVLRPGGVAMLYFGRWAPLSLGRNRPFAYAAERICERFFLAQGYKEIPARVNDTNLLVTLPYAKNFARSLGLEIHGTFVSRRRVPDELHVFGSQHGLLLRKPA